jgi:colanic acid/amylovoran biosynthesis glycosyltransferase
MLSVFPQTSETFIMSKFLGLLQKGYDAVVVCGRQNRAAWKNFPAAVMVPGARRRVREAWPAEPAWLAPFLFPFALIRAILQNPGGVLRYFRLGWRRFGAHVIKRFYLDAEVVGAGPGILHFEFGALAAERMYLAEFLGCRSVVSFRGYDLTCVGLENPDHYRNVWQSADAIHCLGSYLWSRARQRGCPESKQCVLIPPAIDLEFFTVTRGPAGIAGTVDRPLRILSVGRLEWKKGYEFALETVRLLRARGVCVEYHILGGGGYLEAVAFCRNQAGLTDCVALLGPGDRFRVRSEMQWADVFLHAAVTEGFCNAVIEAQAMELPVVCSDAGGLPENVEDGAGGFVVPRRDPAAMARSLERLASDPALRSRMGLAGRRRAEQRFGLTRQIDAFAALYRSLSAV